MAAALIILASSKRCGSLSRQRYQFVTLAPCPKHGDQALCGTTDYGVVAVAGRGRDAAARPRKRMANRKKTSELDPIATSAKPTPS